MSAKQQFKPNTAKETLEELRARVLAQKELVPSLYGKVDFSLTPERFCSAPNDTSFLPSRFADQYRQEVLNDAERVERARLYTLLGDTVSDRYAALMHSGYRMKDLIRMLHQACASGVESVPQAPDELHDFIDSMAQVPDWIDMNLVAQGARTSRKVMACLVPFSLRGAFIATFMNKYSGLPMALTGALSRRGSVEQRINETASFFTAATLPGALDRHGAGFMAAAMVRLMHSIVRFNLLNHSAQWDVSVYGIPIPQVDQMPAGTIPSFINAFALISNGGTRFNRRQRAVVELCRYQCHLLGLPRELLPETPQEIVDAMVTYTATLRDGYDDNTCGELVRATLRAYRPANKKPLSRLYNQLETSFSKVFFVRTFLRGDNKNRAQLMGVTPTPLDYGLFAAVNCFVMPQLIGHSLVQDLPLLGEIADRLLVKQIKQRLKEYGHAEYITDQTTYTEQSRAKQDLATV